MTTFDASVFSTHHITLPMPPKDVAEMSIFTRFMRHLQVVPTHHPAIKVLSAIQFTADFMGYSDAHISKMLVDWGLRAPRKAFPAEFLNYVDVAMPRGDWEIGGPSPSVKHLSGFWQGIGEDPFIAARREYPMMDVDAFV